MNNLLDFAGLLLYYLFLPIIIPVQVILYVLAGFWFACVFCNRMLLSIPHFMVRMRHAGNNFAGRIYAPIWRKKLLKVPA